MDRVVLYCHFKNVKLIAQITVDIVMKGFAYLAGMDIILIIILIFVEGALIIAMIV